MRERRGVGDAFGDGALEALEFCLLCGGEAWWRGARLEGGGVEAVVAWEAEEGARKEAGDDGHCGLVTVVVVAVVVVVVRGVSVLFPGDLI